MTRTTIVAGLTALLLSSAAAQVTLPAPQPDAVPPSANETMPEPGQPFGGDVNQSVGEPAGEVEPVAPAAAPSAADTPSASMPTEGTGAPPPPPTGPDAVPERADGAADATSIEATGAARPGCRPGEGESVSETTPVEGAGSGTAPGGAGSSGWTGGLGGSDIGTSQAEPLPSSVTQAPHPEVASGLDPISGETAVTGPASPPPPAPAAPAAPAPEPAEEETPPAELAAAQGRSPSGEATPSAEAEPVAPAAGASSPQAPNLATAANGEPC